MYQLCSDLDYDVTKYCSSAQTVAQTGAPGRWKHRVPLPRWSPGALTDGVNEAKLVLGLGVWKAGPRCMERVEVDGKRRKKWGERLLGPKLRTLPCLVPKGKRSRHWEEWGNWRKRGRVGWEKIAKSGTRTTVCRAYSIPWESGCGHWPVQQARADRNPTTAAASSSCHVTVTALTHQGKEFHGKLCSVSSSQNIVFGSLFWPTRRISIAFARVR